MYGRGFHGNHPRFDGAERPGMQAPAKWAADSERTIRF